MAARDRRGEHRIAVRARATRRQRYLGLVLAAAVLGSVGVAAAERLTSASSTDGALLSARSFSASGYEGQRGVALSAAGPVVAYPVHRDVPVCCGRSRRCVPP